MVQEEPPLRKAAVATGGVQTVQSSVPMETDSTVMVSNGAAKKKADKILCFCCGKNGHMADGCEAVLCMYCERATHDAKDCHLLKMPKLTATLYGLCRNELMIYEFLFQMS
jgi:hypothetical protein